MGRLLRRGNGRERYPDGPLSHYLWARLTKATDYYTDGSNEQIATLVAGISTGEIRVRCEETAELIPSSMMASYIRLWNKVYPSYEGWPRGCSLPYNIELRVEDVQRAFGNEATTRRKGRPKGTGPNQAADRRLVQDMNRLVSSYKFTVLAAAIAVSARASGNSEQSKIRRLERAYRATFS